MTEMYPQKSSETQIAASGHCRATYEAVEELIEAGDTGCVICGRAAEHHPHESPTLAPCDCRANDWEEGDNGAIRCARCGGYTGEPGTSINIVAAS